eukprot:TRINITY_DN106023_c0_g1_i1.p1 TRINITY_DN106023_c0_g1~~TRINITY_DN106023_c0_g1_i1.p1  ORF type:complete len:390 (+),score=42.50 TRINITY_DN106023_c0_g1_i1:64-1233(+)
MDSSALQHRPPSLCQPFAGKRYRVLVDEDEKLYFLSDDECGEDDSNSLSREIFARKCLASNAFRRPSRFDVESAPDQPTVSDVVAALRQIPDKHWKNTGRANVRHPGVDSVDSLTLGLVTSRSSHGIPMPSTKTRLYPKLTSMLLRFWRQHLRRNTMETNLVCTSITLNKNYAAREHVDANNFGPSWLIAVGDWTSGGKLFVEDPQGSVDHQVESDIQGTGCWRYSAGQLVRGSVLDVHNRWTRFDGRRLHFVSKVAGGDRYSIIFFAMSRHYDAPIEARSQMSVLGFPLPLPGRGKPGCLKLDSRGRVLDISPAPQPTIDELAVWCGPRIEEERLELLLKPNMLHDCQGRSQELEAARAREPRTIQDGRVSKRQRLRKVCTEDAALES